MFARVKQAHESGELVRLAQSGCRTVGDFAKALGLTRDAFEVQSTRARRAGIPVPTVRDLVCMAKMAKPVASDADPGQPPDGDLAGYAHDNGSTEWDDEPTNPSGPSIDVQMAERAQRSELAEAKARIKQLLAEVERVTTERDAVIGAHEAKPQVATIAPREHSSGLREATAVALASDWHIESCVTAAKVNGLNEYNLEIARRRAERFFEGYSWLINYHTRAFAIRDGILWLGGDIITGYLREENLESNLLSPVQAIAAAQTWIADGIRHVLAATPLEHLKVPTNSGNHGRLTDKVRPSTREENSIEWLLYCGLAREFANEPRVEVILPHGVLTYVQVYDWMLRFTHGDAIKYSDGVGGIMIPIMKKLAKWDRGIRADITNVGHFHQYYDLPFLTVNSSLIGLDEYALEIGAVPEDPSQAFYLVDKQRGKSMSARTWLTETKERQAA